MTDYHIRKQVIKLDEVVEIQPRFKRKLAIELVWNIYPSASLFIYFGHTTEDRFHGNQYDYEFFQSLLTKIKNKETIEMLKDLYKAKHNPADIDNIMHRWHLFEKDYIYECMDHLDDGVCIFCGNKIGPYFTILPGTIDKTEWHHCPLGMSENEVIDTAHREALKYCDINFLNNLSTIPV